MGLETFSATLVVKKKRLPTKYFNRTISVMRCYLKTTLSTRVFITSTIQTLNIPNYHSHDPISHLPEHVHQQGAGGTRPSRVGQQQPLGPPLTPLTPPPPGHSSARQ